MSGKFQTKSGLYLGYYDFFSSLVSQLEFKKSPVQVHIIPNFKSSQSFETNLGCIWDILILFSKSVSKLDFKKSSVQVLIALLTNNTGFGPEFSYSDWQNWSRAQSNLEPYIDWLTCPKIRIVGLSFAEVEMDKTVHLECHLSLSGRSKHQFQ